MAGIKLSNSDYGVTINNKDEVEMRQNDKLGRLNLSLNDSLEIVANSVVDISGVQYVFETDEAISGNRYQVSAKLKITADGSTCSAEWSQDDLPDWDYYKRGYYLTSTERIVLQIDSKTGEITDYFDSLAKDSDIERRLLNQNIYMDILKNQNSDDFKAENKRDDVCTDTWSDQYVFYTSYFDTVYILDTSDNIIQVLSSVSNVISVSMTENNLALATATNLYVYYRDTKYDDFGSVATFATGTYSKVKLSGDILIAGNGTTQMTIYHKSGDNTWDGGVTILESTGTNFSEYLAIDGNYIIVSDYTSNMVKIYNRTGDNTWDSGFDLGALFTGTETNVGFGVAIFGDYCSIGYLDSGLNGVRIFERTAQNTWIEDNDLFSDADVNTGQLCQADRYLVYGNTSSTLDNQVIYIYYRDYNDNWILTIMANPKSPTTTYSFSDLYSVSSGMLFVDADVSSGHGYRWDISYLGE